MITALTIFSAQAIGPVWPAMLLCFSYMATTTVFLVLARMRTWFRAFSIREYRFLQRMYDATEMFSTLAILSGMIGTCFGLLEVLPVLGNALHEANNGDLLNQVLSPLRNVWASTIAGLVLGGLWGEILMFFLKPYTRPALLPLSPDDSGAGAYDFEEPEPPSPADDQSVDDDWRRDDVEGIY